MDGRADSGSFAITVDGLMSLSEWEEIGTPTYNPTGSHSESFILQRDDPLSSLWEEFEARNYVKPELLFDDTEAFTPSGNRQYFLPFEEVEVVGPETPSEYGKCINMDETFRAFANRPFEEVVSLNMDRKSSESTNMPLDVVTDDQGLQIAFHRTIRLPDDGKLHQLPASLGAFPLFNVDAYSSRLPETVTEQGGIFLPMWQREALWIQFTCHPKSTYALRIFTGRINAVSGLEMDKAQSDQQDYVVLPDQQWLDGICVSPGVVRQFCAMPLGGGYTIEGQKTSKEKFGGLQIEIIPAYKPYLKLWKLASSKFRTDYGKLEMPYLTEMNTPRESRLTPGDKLRCHPNPATEILLYSLRDMCELSPSHHRFRVKNPSKLPVKQSLGTGNNLSGSRGAPPRFYSSEDTPVSSNPHSTSSRARQPPTDLKASSAMEPKEEIAERVQKMGLAAGGKLVQDIVRDFKPRQYWNKSATRLLNVHILDPASCERVTHIVPPPPPIDAKTYAAAGLPFYVMEEKVDDRLEGGDFENILSVSEMDKKIGVTTESEFDPLKPKMCTSCEMRLCDCIIRPCDHQFCNVCIKKLEVEGEETGDRRANWKCLICSRDVTHVAGFSAPMNLPGQETLKIKVSVTVLQVEDGRVQFQSIQRRRI